MFVFDNRGKMKSFDVNCQRFGNHTKLGVEMFFHWRLDNPEVIVICHADYKKRNVFTRCWRDDSGKEIWQFIRHTHLLHSQSSDENSPHLEQGLDPLGILGKHRG